MARKQRQNMDKNLETIVNRHFGSERGNPILEKANSVYLDLIPLANDESKDRKKNLVDGIYPFVAIYLNLRQNTPHLNGRYLL